MGYNKKEPVFCNLSGSVKKGEITGIIGRNGEGKSTLARLFMWLM
ncbi:ATP-binding cassette domain-containing protein [endosymbiont 'TC1' of Trimyema compressum]